MLVDSINQEASQSLLNFLILKYRTTSVCIAEHFMKDNVTYQYDEITQQRFFRRL